VTLSHDTCHGLWLMADGSWLMEEAIGHRHRLSTIIDLPLAISH